MILPKDKSSRGWWRRMWRRTPERAAGKPGPLTDKERKACVQMVAAARQAGATSGRSDLEGLERLRWGANGLLAMMYFLIQPWAMRQDHGPLWGTVWYVAPIISFVAWWIVHSKLSTARDAFAARRVWYLEEVTGEGVTDGAFLERRRRRQAAERPVRAGEVARHERALHRVFGRPNGGVTDLEALDRADFAVTLMGLFSLSWICDSLSTSALPLPGVIFLVAALLAGLGWGYVVWQMVRVKTFLLSHRVRNLMDLAEGNAADTRG